MPRKNPGLIAATLRHMGYPADIRDVVCVICHPHCTHHAI